VSGVLFLIRRPVFGFIALVYGGLALPIAIGTGSGSAINISMMIVGLLTGLWIFDMMMRERRIYLMQSRAFLPLFLLVISAVISFGFGQLSWFISSPAPVRAQLGGVSLFILSVCAFLVTAHQVKGLRELEWIVWTFLAVSALFLVAYFVPFLSSLITRYYTRAVIDGMFWTWLVALSFSQAVFNNKLAKPWRAAFGMITLISLYILLIDKREWVSGWLPALISIVVMVGIARPRLGIAGGVLLAALYFARELNPAPVVLDQDNTYSLLTRVAAWELLYKIFMVSPIIGLGPANYYFYTALFPIMGYAVYFNSHNNYVDLVLQLGVVGLACFVWFAGEIGWIVWKLRQIAPDGFAKAYIYGALGGLVATMASAMLGDWVLPFVYNVGLDGFRASVLAWVFLGGILVVKKSISET
jgi:hypothetical protein